MAINASSISTSNTLEQFRNQFNNLVTDVSGLEAGTITFSAITATETSSTTINVLEDGTIVFEGATSDAHETTLTVVDPTADRTVSLPNASGTVIVSDSSTNVVTIPDDLLIKDGGTIGNASVADVMTLASTGIVTFKDDIIIKNAGTIGSASDPDAISISSGGVVNISATTANTSASDGALTVAGGVGIAADLTIGDDLRLISDSAVLSFGADSDTTLTHTDGSGLTLNSTNKIMFNDASQFIHAPSGTVLDLAATDEIELTATLIDVVGNLAVSGTIVGSSTLSATTGTFSGILKTDDTTEATSTTDGSLQTDGGLSVAKDAVIGDDLLLLSDSAVLKFGADSDTTLTHTDGSGLTLNSTNKLMFNDASQFIQGASGTVLDIAATDEIELTATLIDVVGNLATSGTGTFGGILKTDDATEATSTTDGSLQTDGGLSVVKDAVFGDDVKLLSDSAVLSFGTNSEITLTHVHNSGLTVTNTVNGTDDTPVVLQLKSEEDAIVANDVIASIEMAAGDSGGSDGATVAAGIHAIAEGTFTGSANATKLVFTTGVSETAAASATAKMTLSSAGLLTIADDFIIKNGGTIGSVSDPDAITIASSGNITVGQNLTVSGDLDVTGSFDISDANITNVGSIALDTITNDGTDITLDSSNDIVIDAAGGNIEFKDAGTLQLTLDMDGTGGAQVIKLGVNGDDLIFKQFDGTTVLTLDDNTTVKVATDLTVGDDLSLISDSSVLSFGANSEVTLTHVHNTGLTLTHTATGDNTPIVLQLKSEEDAIIANEVIASIEMAAGDSGGTDGATVAAGIHAIAEGTFSASANATKLVFTTGVSETAAASATAKMTLSSAGLLTIADDFMIKDGGTIGVASTNDAMTISSAGIVTFKDDIIIKDAGTIGSASDPDAISISSGGVVNISATTANTSASDGALTVGGGAGIAADLSVGDDLRLISDSAVLSFGANSEVTLTHVHNDGLLLNADMQLQFRDSAINIRSDADGDLDINADDEIELNSTLIDINGNVEISGTTTQTGISTSTAKDVFNASLSVKNGSSSAGFIEFFEDSDNGTNKVTLIGAASTADVTLTLPSATDTLATAGDVTALAIALG